MTAALSLSADTRGTTGVLLLTLVAVEFGGVAVLRMLRGQRPATDFQKSFARAGHAHAGVLIVLALVAEVLADAAGLHGPVNILARDGIWVAALLFPLGFFLSSAKGGATAPNRLIVLLYAGVVALASGLVSLGVGLLTA